MAVVDAAVRTKLFLDHVDAHLMEQRALTTRNGRLKPLLEQRQRLAEGLLRLLTAVGLERRTTVRTLADELAEVPAAAAEAPR